MPGPDDFSPGSQLDGLPPELQAEAGFFGLEKVLPLTVSDTLLLGVGPAFAAAGKVYGGITSALAGKKVATSKATATSKRTDRGDKFSSPSKAGKAGFIGGAGMELGRFAARMGLEIAGLTTGLIALVKVFGSLSAAIEQLGFDNAAALALLAAQFGSGNESILQALKDLAPDEITSLEQELSGSFDPDHDPFLLRLKEEDSDAPTLGNPASAGDLLGAGGDLVRAGGEVGSESVSGSIDAQLSSVGDSIRKRRKVQNGVER